MRKQPLLFLLMLFTFLKSYTQGSTAVTDSLKVKLEKAATAADKVYYLDILSRTLMNVSIQEAENYGKKLIFVAEETRDRRLMIDAYMSNGLRCSYMAGQRDYVQRSIEYYSKALEIARQAKLDECVGAAQLSLATIYRRVPDKDKALSYTNQAFAILSSIKNDSLLAEAYNSYGNVYLIKNEKTLALRNFLYALRIAENIKNAESKISLQRNCYLYLSSFYSGIEDYDKAIDYYTLANQKLLSSKDPDARYQQVIDINSIGNLFASKKNYDLAIDYFERSIALADSLKFPTLKVPGYVSLLNQYLRIDQPQKALEYMNSSSGQGLKNYLNNFGFAGTIDQAYAVIYTQLAQYDSARFYFNKALPYFEQNINETNRIGFYSQLASFYKKANENEKAITYYQKVKVMADRAGILEYIQGAAKNLDTLYSRTGQYALAMEYNDIYYKYKDSIDRLNKEKELAQVEADDEQYRQKRIEEDIAIKKKQRNNIQYVGITIGILGLFILLVVLGMFKVSTRTIRLIGFFAFLMFFEFIFLIFKKNIASITQGEPLKDLAFMIALAALLVPLHHWLEHKVIKYLTSHNRLTSTGQTLLSKIFVRKEKEV